MAESTLDYRTNIDVLLDGKIIGHIKESRADGKSRYYPGFSGFYYKPKQGRTAGSIFPTVAEVKRSLEW